MVKPQMNLNQKAQHRWLKPSSIFHICYREVDADLVHGKTWHLEETKPDQMKMIIRNTPFCLWPYHPECAQSHLISETKQG
jgi:hypothetical protein